MSARPRQINVGIILNPQFLIHSVTRLLVSEDLRDQIPHEIETKTSPELATQRFQAGLFATDLLLYHPNSSDHYEIRDD